MITSSVPMVPAVSRASSRMVMDGPSPRPGLFRVRVNSVQSTRAVNPPDVVAGGPKSEPAHSTVVLPASVAALFLIRDRDSKYPKLFNAILADTGSGTN